MLSIYSLKKTKKIQKMSAGQVLVSKWLFQNLIWILCLIFIFAPSDKLGMQRPRNTLLLYCSHIFHLRKKMKEIKQSDMKIWIIGKCNFRLCRWKLQCKLAHHMHWHFFSFLFVLLSYWPFWFDSSIDLNNSSEEDKE